MLGVFHVYQKGKFEYLLKKNSVIFKKFHTMYLKTECLDFAENTYL